MLEFACKKKLPLVRIVFTPLSKRSAGPVVVSVMYLTSLLVGSGVVCGEITTPYAIQFAFEKVKFKAVGELTPFESACVLPFVGVLLFVVLLPTDVSDTSFAPPPTSQSPLLAEREILPLVPVPEVELAFVQDPAPV